MLAATAAPRSTALVVVAMDFSQTSIGASPRRGASPVVRVRRAGGEIVSEV
jgi:hypothetical protein